MATTKTDAQRLAEEMEYATYSVYELKKELASLERGRDSIGRGVRIIERKTHLGLYGGDIVIDRRIEKHIEAIKYVINNKK